MDDLTDKVAVVTGAASGIGRGIATALAAEGCHVVVADIDELAAHAVAAQLAGTGVQALAATCDVTDRNDVEKLADRAFQHFGHVDIAVNNAGVFPPIRRAIAIEEQDARWVLEVNLMGAWYGCSAFGRRFTEQGTAATGLDPAGIGRAAVAGIKRGDFYIVTHPPVREIAAEILAAFDAQAPRYAGDEAIDTRAIVKGRPA